MDNIMVSICCAVYNHKPYLEQTLEGFLSQKTSFSFEVIINDDVSTDGSRELLDQYEKKYPDIIKVIFQNENQYAKKKKIVFDILAPIARGKYIAICEGDDYWSDPYKLQRQVDVMEKEKNCSVCVHKVRDIDKDGKKLPNTYPSELVKEGLIQQEEFIKMLFAPSRYWFHVNSFLFRAKYLKKFNGEYPEFIKVSGVGDVPLTWLLVNEGDIFYIDKEMSVYRRDAVGSWSAKMQNRDYRKQMSEMFCNSLTAYNSYTNYKYDEMISQDIIKSQFDYLRLTNQIFLMRQSKFSKLYNQLSWRQKMTYLNLHFFPILENLYKFVHKEE